MGADAVRSGRARLLHDLLAKQREEFIREMPTHWAKASLRGTPGPTISLADRLCSLEMRETDLLKSGPVLVGPAGPATPPLPWSCVQSCNNLHTTYSYLPQANTARVVFSWNDVDPTMPDGSDAMYHGTTGRGSASLNLLGGLPDPPPDPSDTRSFTFTVNNVCISSVNQS